MGRVVAMIDYIDSLDASKALASRIQNYWHSRGYLNVKVWVETVSDLQNRKHHYVRSNIKFTVPTIR